MVVKKKTTWNGKLSKLMLHENNIVDENGEIINLIDYLEQFYADKVFEISITAKEEEELEYEEELVI